MTAPGRAARRRILREHEPVLEAVDACADAVASAWNGDVVTDRRAVAPPLRALLREAGLLDRLTTVLEDAVDAAGHSLRARPVPAPPYVVVTSRGPVLRATIDPGRLVVGLEVFEVVRGPETGYRRSEGVDLAVSLE